MNKTIILIMVVLYSPLLWAGDTTTVTSLAKHGNDLFTGLVGSWNGEAIETPVGPVGYGIDFHQCDGNLIAGVANTGASRHFWQFWKQDDELRLTFMSTFRGNRTPTQLVANRVENNTLWFHAPKLELLTLSITPDAPHIHIRIFHHHQPHVYIRLTRAEGNMTDSKREASRSRSCQSLV